MKEHYHESAPLSSLLTVKTRRTGLSRPEDRLAVCLQEGCSIDALTSVNILVTSALDALDLLLNPKRLKATLRY